MKTYVFLVVALVVGCDHQQQHARSGNDHAEKDHADEHAIPDDPAIVAAAARVRVLSSDLSCTQEALGIVDVHEPVETVEAAMEILKRRAAARGAEAVTGVEFRHGEGGHEKTHLSGMAVRCRDVLRGRRYDVLEKIEIAASMGDEDEAFQKLRARARELGANVILDVRFGHGESIAEGLKLSGTAVRAYD